MSARSASRFVRHLISLMLALFAPASSLVQAQSFELDRYRPAPLASDGLTVAGADVPGSLGFSAALHADYAHNPLIVELATGKEYQVVDHQLALHLTLALGLGERFMLFAGAPLNLLLQGNEPPTGIVTRLPTPEGAGIGDPYLGGRLRLLGSASSRVAVSTQVSLALPLASLRERQLYSGDDAVGVEPELLLDVHLGRTTLRINLGVRVRENERLLQTWVRDELTFAAAAEYALSKQLRLLAEFYGASALQGFGQSLQTPLELLFGAKCQHPGGFFAALAAGPGVVHGIGAPDVRAVATLGFARKRPQSARAAATDFSQHELSPISIEATQRAAHAEFLRGPPAQPLPSSSVDQVAASPPAPGLGENSESDTESARDASEPLVAPAPTQLQILARVHFASGDDRAVAGSFAALRELKQMLVNNPTITLVRVDGHTDAAGDELANLNLSTRRARAVERWLRDNGVAVERLRVVGCGELRPTSSPRRDPAMDRRVEIQVGSASDSGCAPLH